MRFGNCEEGAEVPFPGSVASLDRRATGHALAGGRSRSCPTRRSSGRSSGRAPSQQMGNRDVSDVTDALRELPRKELVRPGTPFVDRGGIRVRVLAHPRPRRRVRAAPPSVSSISPRRGGPGGLNPRHPNASRVSGRHARVPLHDGVGAHPCDGGETSTRPDSRHRPCDSSSLAGERALGLDTTTAMTSLERALALAPSKGIRARIAALFRFGEAAFQGGTPEPRQSDALDEADQASFTADGDLPAAARAMGALGKRRGPPGGSAGGRSCRRDALALLEPLRPLPRARRRAHRGRPRRGAAQAI